MVKKTFSYGEDVLNIATCIALARGTCRGILSPRTREKILTAAGHVKNLVAQKRTVYGVNTGFGHLCNTKIDKKSLKALQENLLKSHSVGVGEALSEVLVRLMIILKVHALSQGYSGVSLLVVERLLYFLEEHLIPRVPEKGSLGASGDLAPLAHLSLPLIGLGELWDANKKAFVPSLDLLQKKKKQPIVLSPKDGLALINGTQFMGAHAVWGLWQLQNCLEHADLIAAMSIEAFMGSAEPFDARLHKIRPHVGAQFVADRMRYLLHGSGIMQTHINCERIQDPYSFRCIPQVHGASWNAWLHAKETTEVEINAVTDNPIIWDEHTTLNGGNFHGQPLALPLDYATLAAAEVGSVAERRIYQLSHGGYKGVPKLLIRESGLHSGFMILQYTAAALVSENKILTHPASADSIPSSLGQEDHVSMGAIGSRKLNEVVENVAHVLAIELLFSTQALSFRRPLRSSDIIEACHKQVRSKVSFVETDRCFYKDMEQAFGIVKAGALIETYYTMRKRDSTASKEAHNIFVQDRLPTSSPEMPLP